MIQGDGSFDASALAQLRHHGSDEQLLWVGMDVGIQSNPAGIHAGRNIRSAIDMDQSVDTELPIAPLARKGEP